MILAAAILLVIVALINSVVVRRPAALCTGLLALLKVDAEHRHHRRKADHREWHVGSARYRSDDEVDDGTSDEGARPESGDRPRRVSEEFSNFRGVALAPDGELRSRQNVSARDPRFPRISSCAGLEEFSRLSGAARPRQAAPRQRFTTRFLPIFLRPVPSRDNRRLKASGSFAINLLVDPYDYIFSATNTDNGKRRPICHPIL